MRTDSEEQKLSEESTGILHTLFLGRQKVILEFLDKIREYIKNSFPMTLFNYIADFYETFREMFGNYQLEMHDPVRLSTMPSEEKVEETKTMFSEMLESLRRVEEPEDKKEEADENDLDNDYAKTLEAEYQKMLEDIENRFSIRFEKGLPTPEAMNDIDETSHCGNSISSTSRAPDSVESREEETNDQEEDDERLVQEKFQRKFAEQNQRYQEELEKLRQRRRAQQH